MKFTITRDNLLRGLQFVSGVIERRQNIPILSNVLLKLNGSELSLTGTDHEIELLYRVDVLESQFQGQTTLSGRKLIDICKQFSPNDQMDFSLDSNGNKMVLQVGKSRFVLATLPAEDFPLMSFTDKKFSLSMQSQMLEQLISTTSFAMAEQDVRYYMNGLFFELNINELTAVATDGHRLSFCQKPFKHGLEDKETGFIFPRKSILEFLRILNSEDDEVLVFQCAQNAVKIETPKFTFISRLIEGNFPNYRRVVPKELDKKAVMDRDSLKRVLQRMLIFTAEKNHAARLSFQKDTLSLYSHNTENEEAVDEISMDYTGENTEIAFNIHYLLDALNVLPEGNIQIHFSQNDKSVCIDSEKLPGVTHIIMPMSL